MARTKPRESSLLTILLAPGAGRTYLQAWKETLGYRFEFRTSNGLQTAAIQNLAGGDRAILLDGFTIQDFPQLTLRLLPA